MSSPERPTSPDDLIARKIFPRNLTARAAVRPKGNSAGTRPESGVDNCFPGLEFDQRNLDKAFFPGLVFEFHRDDGAILVATEASHLPAEVDLTGDTRSWYLWAVAGGTASGTPVKETPQFFLMGLSGLAVWRRVHDLAPGKIVVLIGPEPGFSAAPPTDATEGMAALIGKDGHHVARSATGGLRWIAIAGDRARYLTDDGVIDPQAFPPGELTRSLCAPWQYDFRDCGCFYWASNKPDLVTSAGGEHPSLNFQRRDRTSPVPDLATYLERRPLEIDYAALVAGAWNSDLPVVINDRESDQFTPAPAPTVSVLMDRAEVIRELRYLATVEHALCVEYLFAHYSLAAPIELPETGASAKEVRIFAAANEIFRIAVDEMRHLRWVNEALTLLGEPPELGRADRIGRELDKPFTLEPLTPERLQWFIAVEAPSQSIEEGIDGMYVRLHVSIDRQPEMFKERERLVPLMKLIIDEGGDHYSRFRSVEAHLTGLDPAEYLRVFGGPDAAIEHDFLDLGDQNYRVLLGALAVTFQLGDRAGGTLLQQSRRAMFGLHETNHLLAARGVGPRFTLPSIPSLDSPAAASALLATLSQELGTRMIRASAFGPTAMPREDIALRLLRSNKSVVDRMREIVENLTP